MSCHVNGTRGPGWQLTRRATAVAAAAARKAPSSHMPRCLQRPKREAAVSVDGRSRQVTLPDPSNTAMPTRPAPQAHHRYMCWTGENHGSCMAWCTLVGAPHRHPPPTRSCRLTWRMPPAGRRGGSGHAAALHGRRGKVAAAPAADGRGLGKGQLPPDQLHPWGDLAEQLLKLGQAPAHGRGRRRDRLEARCRSGGRVLDGDPVEQRATGQVRSQGARRGGGGLVRAGRCRWVCRRAGRQAGGRAHVCSPAQRDQRGRRRLGR
jgi:hypothetical protein